MTAGQSASADVAALLPGPIASTTASSACREARWPTWSTSRYEVCTPSSWAAVSRSRRERGPGDEVIRGAYPRAACSLSAGPAAPAVPGLRARRSRGWGRGRRAGRAAGRAPVGLVRSVGGLEQVEDAAGRDADPVGAHVGFVGELVHGLVEHLGVEHDLEL